MGLFWITLRGAIHAMERKVWLLEWSVLEWQEPAYNPAETTSRCSLQRGPLEAYIPKFPQFPQIVLPPGDPGVFRYLNL